MPPWRRKKVAGRARRPAGERTTCQVRVPPRSNERNPMQANEPPPTSVLAGVLSYLVPGLGQILQGRVGKGLLFFVCLVSLFHVGQAMGNWQNVYLPSGDTHFARDQVRPANPLA